MHSRLAALKRLMSLYGGIEEIHSVDLQRATAAVREAEQAIDLEVGHAHVSNLCSRDALIAGDALGVAAARTQREIAEWRQRRLREIRLEREVLKDEARKRYIATRLQSEQMKYVVDNTATQMEVEAGRKMQTALDDRFLARRRWSDAREESRASTEISSS